MIVLAAAICIVWGGYITDPAYPEINFIINIKIHSKGKQAQFLSMFFKCTWPKILLFTLAGLSNEKELLFYFHVTQILIIVFKCIFFMCLTVELVIRDEYCQCYPVEHLEPFK